MRTALRVLYHVLRLYPERYVVLRLFRFQIWCRKAGRRALEVAVQLTRRDGKSQGQLLEQLLDGIVQRALFGQRCHTVALPGIRAHRDQNRENFDSEPIHRGRLRIWRQRNATTGDATLPKRLSPRFVAFAAARVRFDCNIAMPGLLQTPEGCFRSAKFVHALLAEAVGVLLFTFAATASVSPQQTAPWAPW